ncbi:protein-export chaperone SecB [Micromonospora parva]|uniref:protein-export chaperone SecB n=1 Tax=Micromonospora parva TaxID=1464048 RepID=UPI00340B87FE
MQVRDELQRKAARVAANAELRDVRATELQADLISIPESDDLTFEVATESAYSSISDEGRCVYRLRVAVVAREGEEEVFKAQVTMAALYSLPPDASDDELRAFGDVTAALALYPYVRAAIQDLAARTGIPSVTLPVYQVALELEDGESPPVALSKIEAEDQNQP